MANDEHVALLKKGVDAWNAWRDENPTIHPDLSGADLSGADLSEANLSNANLMGADLSGADLNWADLGGANLTEADLGDADLRAANLVGTTTLREAYSLSDTDFGGAVLSKLDLSGMDLRGLVLLGANLSKANLSGANLCRANLGNAHLNRADLSGADLSEANLEKAFLTRANFSWAILARADLSDASARDANLMGAMLREAYLGRSDLRGADLSHADLSCVGLVDADITGADLTGCRVYGVSAWDLKRKGAKQQDLIITKENDPEITVDNIEVAQFIYLMLNNEKVRDVINTITSKAVLILGRFTAERKAVLDALREELRKRDYLPILFDFNVPATRDITETVSLLARMARFIIADLTNPSSVPKELEAIVPQLAVPVQPLLEGASRPYAMFKDYWKYDWVLPVYRYEGLEPLLATIAEKVIAPAEGKVKALEERRRVIEAELTKPQ
jgi:uncharacterized protein YjbI with pentapeptide repeats